jgi:hypothetical protein
MILIGVAFGFAGGYLYAMFKVLDMFKDKYEKLRVA